jgi:hypothetical protein
MWTHRSHTGQAVFDIVCIAISPCYLSPYAFSKELVFFSSVWQTLSEGKEKKKAKPEIESL